MATDARVGGKYGINQRGRERKRENGGKKEAWVSRYWEMGKSVAKAKRGAR